ncbi:MAG: nucleotidyltransferase family protein [Sedimentisphaerales bacterium]|nr:nucleotidyltransferase family protein [Sedimentisphaerales bacterium]
MINAVILAAGESRRMGMPKPLLRFGNTTFLGQIISVLQHAAIERITVVLGAEAERLVESVDLSGTEVVVNHDYRDGQSSSLVAALREVPAETEAILLCLVDNPFITPEIVNEVVGAYRQTNHPIVIPVQDGKRGHPALFARSVFGELLDAPADQGARYVVRSDPERVLEVEVADRAVAVRIDTPDQYKEHFGIVPQIRSRMRETS